MRPSGSLPLEIARSPDERHSPVEHLKPAGISAALPVPILAKVLPGERCPTHRHTSIDENPPPDVWIDPAEAFGMGPWGVGAAGGGPGLHHREPGGSIRGPIESVPSGSREPKRVPGRSGLDVKATA